MKSVPIPSALFVRNRGKLAGLMAPGSIALAGSGDPMLRNGDQYYPYRQDSDFYYLTGINQVESLLLLAPGSKDPAGQEILFIKQPTIKSRVWTGPGLSLRKAAALSGIHRVRWLEDLDGILERMVPAASSVYLSGRTIIERISARYPGLSYPHLSPLMAQLRMLKESEELNEIKKACAITRAAFLRLLPVVKAGMWEYEIEAEITAEFLRQGAEGHAYEPIVAGGKNALILHYVANNHICREGDLVLLDFGAEVNNYAADCSRTIPVNGRFSKRQRMLYEAVLRVFRKSVELMVPGISMADLNKQAGELWVREHINLGLYTQEDTPATPDVEPLWKNYFMHGISHSLGLDVHDPFDRTQPLQAGMVLTCEPAIYLPEEGIGIRLENDILITEHGPVDLMADIPIEADEIEAFMQSNR